MCAPGVGLVPAKRRLVPPVVTSVSQRVVAFGLNRCTLLDSTSFFIWRSVVTSTIQMLRPCVATAISPAVGWIATSWIATVGRLLLILVQYAPRSRDA